jgi:hypothetical protein
MELAIDRSRASLSLGIRGDQFSGHALGNRTGSELVFPHVLVNVDSLGPSNSVHSEEPSPGLLERDQFLRRDHD